MPTHGLERVLAKLDKIGSGLGAALQGATAQAGDYTVQQVPGYPAPPAGSTYVRTFDLGESISSEPVALGSATGLFGQTLLSVGVPYAPHVVDAKTQADVHKGRWWTIQAVLVKATAGIVRIYSEAIRNLLR